VRHLAGSRSCRARQRTRLNALFAGDVPVEVETTWAIYQHMIPAYRAPDRGRQLMQKLIDSLSDSVPAALIEVITLGRTLKQRSADVLAYFKPAGTSNRPTEAINGRLGSRPRFRPRVLQPHQLHRQMPTRSRRIQTATTPSIVKSPLWTRVNSHQRCTYLVNTTSRK
jgi:hypothetical protein